MRSVSGGARNPSPPPRRLEELVLGALRAGARGFLLKDAFSGLLLEAVRTVAAEGLVAARGSLARLQEAQGQI